MNVGLILAGGGVKGAAHIGAIKALQEENIHFNYIAGTSSGSIVAALYALGYTPEEMYKIFKTYMSKIHYVSFKNIIKAIYGLIFKRKFILSGLNDGKVLEKIVAKLSADKNIYNINEIRMPLAIPSVDLCTGKVIVFSSKKILKSKAQNELIINNVPIGKAVRSSCSYPGVFSPVKYNKMHLVDGGVKRNIAWQEVKMLGADKTVCITFESKYSGTCNDNIIDNVKESAQRTVSKIIST